MKLKAVVGVAVPVASVTLKVNVHMFAMVSVKLGLPEISTAPVAGAAAPAANPAHGAVLELMDVNVIVPNLLVPPETTTVKV